MENQQNKNQHYMKLQVSFVAFLKGSVYLNMEDSVRPPKFSPLWVVEPPLPMARAGTVFPAPLTPTF